MMFHCLHGGGNHGNHNGFTALGKTIGTSKSTETDADYVTEHQVLKYLSNKISHYLHDYHSHWFPQFRLPPPNREHDQLRESQIRRLMRRVQVCFGHRGGGSGRDRPEIQVFSRLDIGNKDFFGEQFVNCRPFGSHHEQVLMDFVFQVFIPPPPFFEGTCAKFDVTLENCWYGRVLLLFCIRVKTDTKDQHGRSVLMDCNCAMIDCLFDYAPGCRLHLGRKILKSRPLFSKTQNPKKITLKNEP
jgi:hypothetical protein